MSSRIEKWILGIVVMAVVSALLYAVISSRNDDKRREQLIQAWNAKNARQQTAEETAMVNALRAHTKESRTKVMDLIIPAYGEPIAEADAKLSRNFQVLDDGWAREVEVRKALEKRIAALERKVGRAEYNVGPRPVAMTTPNVDYQDIWHTNFTSARAAMAAVERRYGGKPLKWEGGSGTVSWSSASGTSEAIPASTSSCSSAGAAINEEWKPIQDAPRDGTVIEVLETYGIAPWYGIYKWVELAGPYSDDRTPRGHWMSAENDHTGVIENPCLFWRSYNKTGKYIDPTNGAQDTVEYQCQYMHRPYDKAKDACR